MNNLWVRGWLARDSIRNMRILIVEDNASNRKVAMLMLDHLGYEYDAVSNGREAIQAVEHCHYDLVLMDIIMPEIDGLEATQKIRKLNKTGLKIIAITAYVFPGIREMCLDAGMDDYIPKPVKIEDLAEVLKKYR
ncbi:MAG: response regulator [Methanotrichaceae archaeon]